MISVGLLVLVLLAVVEGAVLIEMVKQVAQLRQRADLDDQPLPISLGLHAGAAFPRADLVEAEGITAVVFLSSDCSSCRAIGAAIPRLSGRLRERLRISPIVEGRTPDDIQDFLRETLLGEQEIVVDYERELGRATGIGTRPAAVMLHNGAMIDAAAIRTPRQLNSFIERASQTLAEELSRRAPDRIPVAAS